MDKITDKFKPISVDAIILFADIIDSVSISGSVSPLEYNSLISDFHKTATKVIEEDEAFKKVREWRLHGDELFLAFYTNAVPPKEKAYDKTIESLQYLAYSAMRIAFRIKTSWALHPRNLERIRSYQPMHELAMGIHRGIVVYDKRASDEPSIEGYSINIAKRIENASRKGVNTKIFVSQEFLALLSSIKFKQEKGEVPIQEKASFLPTILAVGELKGTNSINKVFELNSIRRLTGYVKVLKEEYDLLEEILSYEPVNMWAYQVLMDSYLYDQENEEKALGFARRAFDICKDNPNVLFDLCLLHYSKLDLPVAGAYALEYIKHDEFNPGIWDILGGSYAIVDDHPNAVKCFAKAVAISPKDGSVYLRLSKSLLIMEQKDLSKHYYELAIENWKGKDADVELGELKTLLGEMHNDKK